MLGTLLSALLTLPVLASGNYQPPAGSGQSSGGRVTTTGVRGCIMEDSDADLEDADLALLPLAPSQHVGQTAFTHPTFTWFVPNVGGLAVSEPTITFALYQVDSAGDPIKVFETALPNASGVMTFALPPNEPGLIPGDRYIWSVSLGCDEDDPSNFMLARAELMVTPQVIGSTLATSRLEDALDLAQSGLWYDAIAFASLDPANQASQAIQVSLIEDLADLEALSEASSSDPWPFSAQLRLIAQQLSELPN
ncbi:MAG: DUF928 domain-containing protein [Leptolyngbyaceae cyanobacterium]